MLLCVSCQWTIYSWPPSVSAPAEVLWSQIESIFSPKAAVWLPLLTFSQVVTFVTSTASQRHSQLDLVSIWVLIIATVYGQVSYANCLLISGYLSLVSCSTSQVRGRRGKSRWMTAKMVPPLSTNQQEVTRNVHICKIQQFPEMWIQNHKLTFNQGCKTVMMSMLDDGD